MNKIEIEDVLRGIGTFFVGFCVGWAVTDIALRIFM